MIVAGIFIVIAIALFVAAFASKRRFGLLGLALTAGATISEIWQTEAGYVVSALGIIPDATIASAVSLSAVVLLPAILLLFHGYKYKSVVPRIVGSFLFAVLALAFLLEPIGYALPLEGTAADFYNIMKENKDLIISAGVVLAVVDLFFTKPVKTDSHDKDKKRH